MSETDSGQMGLELDPAAAALAEKLRSAPAHKYAAFANAERMALERAKWIAKNSAYYRDDRR